MLAPSCKHGTRRSDDLEPWQVKRLLKELLPLRDFLFKLQRRMNQRNFLPNDPLLMQVMRATSQVDSLVAMLEFEVTNNKDWKRR